MTDRDAPGRGRFAPSPTGPLHFGSLVAALGSFLQARSTGQEWLVRMEDLDPPREQPGAAAAILSDLERFGLRWDREVLYQSTRHEAYAQALDSLRATGLSFSCSCSRKDIAAANGVSGGVYPGTCRDGPRDRSGPLATRIRVDPGTVSFEDTLQGTFVQDLAQEVGDFVLRRRDGLFAYQLAVVLDDAYQGISEIVRGTDLLDNTPRQIFLQRLLSLPTPSYLHLPIVVNADGAKLSKQTGARPIDADNPAAALVDALAFLRQSPPAELGRGRPADVLEWARENWDLRPLRGLRSAQWETPGALDAAQ